VVGRPHVDNRSLHSFVGGFLLRMLTGDRVGHLGENGGSSVEKGRESDVES
jgi:hypothetical protein